MLLILSDLELCVLTLKFLLFVYLFFTDIKALFLFEHGNVKAIFLIKSHYFFMVYVHLRLLDIVCDLHLAPKMS